jgi:hypothetical protein
MDTGKVTDLKTITIKKGRKLLLDPTSTYEKHTPKKGKLKCKYLFLIMKV